MPLDKETTQSTLKKLITQGQTVSARSPDGSAWLDRCTTIIKQLFPNDDHRTRPFKASRFVGPLAAYAPPDDLKAWWESGRQEALAALRRALEDVQAGLALVAEAPVRSGDFSRSQVTYVQGDQITQNIHGSTVGTAVAGRAASVGVSASPTQEEWKADIRALQQALVRDQDALDEMQQGTYEAFSQVLRLLRDVSVEGAAQAAVQARIEETVADIWVQHQLPRLKPATADALEVLRMAAKLASPLTTLTTALTSMVID